jgi:hypothetical protein
MNFKNLVGYKKQESDGLPLRLVPFHRRKIISLQEEKSRLSEIFITSNNPMEHLSDLAIEGLFE